MSSLTEMNEALRHQAANINRPRAGIVETLVRAMKRRHTANLLRQLDARLLDDIGIRRGEIDQIAAEAAAEAVIGKSALALLRMASLMKRPASIWASIAKAWQRQSTIVALQRLSSHTLADIGIERGRIAETVDAMMAATPAPARATVTTKAATAKPAEIAVPTHQVAA